MPNSLRVAYTLEQCWHDVPGGSANAALEVAAGLRDRSEVALVGVAGRHRRGPATGDPPVPVRQLGLARPWLYESWNRLGRPRVESVTGPIDLCHSTVAIPAGTSASHVVTVHDVDFVRHPDRFTRHGARVMRAGLERCRAVDLVLCPGRATIEDLVELGFDRSRLRLVPWGVHAIDVSDADRTRVVGSYSLPDRFVLSVGTLEPRKNLRRLAEAVAHLDEPLPLVLVGPTGWGEPVPEHGDVRFLGFVPGVDLPSLYAASDVFAYPSLHEGFGLPVAEAMAQGTPVVTSRGTATEEVAGGAAVLVDPLDVDSISSGLEEALRNRSALVRRGRQRAAQLTWVATVDATIAAYREVAR